MITIVFKTHEKDELDTVSGNLDELHAKIEAKVELSRSPLREIGYRIYQNRRSYIYKPSESISLCNTPLTVVEDGFECPGAEDLWHTLQGTNVIQDAYSRLMTLLRFLPKKDYKLQAT